MKRLVLIAAVALWQSSTTASAAPICVESSLAAYIGLGAGGCSVGSTVVSGFATVPGQSGAAILDPSLVLVTPGAGPGLLFSLNSTAGVGQLLESIFRFNATGQLGSAGIELLSSSATGDGAATGILDVCQGGSFPSDSPSGCPTSAVSALALVTEQFSVSDTQPLSGSFFDVFVDLAVDGGSGGAATLGAAQVSFTSVTDVPEPAMFGPLALGLVGMGWFGNTRRSRQR